jgi:hypothetical protein
MSDAPGEGDYVLATKYSDGDPRDQWAVGFYDEFDAKGTGRHYIVDSEGKQMRVNGFRRVERISAAFGAYILSDVQDIEWSEKSLWEHLEEWRTNCR